MSRTCPYCRAAFEGDESSPCRPFCSPRCKKLDLLNWLEGAYTLPREISAEDLADLPPEQQDEVLALLLGEERPRSLH
mgnify:CR=1 FL=1